MRRGGWPRRGFTTGVVLRYPLLWSHEADSVWKTSKSFTFAKLPFWSNYVENVFSVRT